MSNPDTTTTTTSKSRDEGLSIIADIVTDCLDLDDGEARPESRLFEELGCDSLDFIDIVFSLERRFGVNLREGELDFLTRLDLSNPDVMKDGLLTRPTVDALARWIVDLSEVDDRDRVTPAELFALIRLETLWRVVSQQLATR